MNNIVVRIAFAVATLLGLGSALAATRMAMEEWPADRGKNVASLQNGARLFANYCTGCHSASLVRWNFLRNIGLDDSQIKDFLIFGRQKVGDTMRIAAAPADQKSWFGKAPPDLSVITRARTSFDYLGTDYIYTLLRGYYRDNGSPTGWNNVAFPSIGMPHVFWEAQGPREATIEQVHERKDEKTGRKHYVKAVTAYDQNGNAMRKETDLGATGSESFNYAFKPLDLQKARQFDSDAADLVAFLAFVTDPSRATRIQIGVWVLIFLAFFSVAAWRLNAVYWKDIK